MKIQIFMQMKKCVVSLLIIMRIYSIAGDVMKEEVFGQPVGEKYTPFIKVKNVKGRMSRGTEVVSYKTKRTHHFLSDIEYNYFLYLEWSDDVVDIREQFPLNLRSTQEIALGMNVKHPADKGSDVVMSTDFVITLKNGKSLARTVKPASELDKKRVLEKLSIEREYWSKLDVDWGIVTEKEIDKVFVNNIQIIRAQREYILNQSVKETRIKELSKLIKESGGTLDDVFCVFNQAHNYQTNRALHIFLSLVAYKFYKIDLFKEFSPSSIHCKDVKVIDNANLS